jgi:hypothetical protein
MALVTKHHLGGIIRDGRDVRGLIGVETSEPLNIEATPTAGPLGPPISPVVPTLLNATRDSISTDPSASFRRIIGS